MITIKKAAGWPTMPCRLGPTLFLPPSLMVWQALHFFQTFSPWPSAIASLAAMPERANVIPIVGQPAAAVKGYKYSKAMKASGLTWDEATLDKYLKKPKGLVKKTKMAFAGLKKEKDRKAIIAYLKSGGK